MKRLLLLAAALAFLLPGTAQAKWHVASSDHFVIYADDRAKDVARFAEILERYHLAMERLTRQQVPTPSPSNRVTIYAVGGERAMERLSGSRIIAGFYHPRAGGSVAFVQDIRFGGRGTDFTLTVLLHEYAHHFLMSSSRYALPRWINEGSAEFYASAKFKRDGEMQIGMPANHRATELFYAPKVDIRDLLDYENRADKSRSRFDSFYGRSWLLYHFLTFDEARNGQLVDYILALRAGKTPIEAGEEAFGDLDQLDKDLDAYLERRRMLAITYTADFFQPGPIEVRELSEGHAEAMPLIIRSRRGVDREQALDLLPEMREVAQQFPKDANVLAALAEAEYDAGNNAEAIAAADSAIALDPTIANAYVQKGYAMFRMAEDADDRTAAYQDAMAPFIALNARENNHPIPLIYLFRKYAWSGAEPSETAKDALFMASELAPFDENLTLNTAVMFAREGRIDVARAYLHPLAMDPHGGELAEYAQGMFDALADAEEGVPFTYDPMDDEAPVAEADEGTGSGEDEPGEPGEPGTQGDD